MPGGADSNDPPALRPPLKWAGGKRWQVPHLAPLWRSHAHRRLVEPFCGGLAVTLGLRPARALLNDANPHVINFYRWLARGLVIESRLENDEGDVLRATAIASTHCCARDSRRRSEAAGLFYYLNRTCYNGLCRFNRSGAFNVPFGRYHRIRYVSDFTSLLATRSRRGRSRAAISLRSPIAPSDFVYADPPYDVDFTHYARGGFSWADQERTAAWLAQHPGPVVLVNQSTPRIRSLYRWYGFELRFLNGPRHINCTGDRTPAREVVAVRNL